MRLARQSHFIPLQNVVYFITLDGASRLPVGNIVGALYHKL